MYKCALRSTILGVMVLAGCAVLAQNSVSSPYSKYGIGALSTNEFVPLRSMGGISTAFSDQYMTNLTNPASLASLQATSFEMGFEMYRSRLKEVSTDQSDGFWGGSITYFSLAFPLINPVNRLLDRRKNNFNWGMGFALLPHSRVSHFSSVDEVIENVGRVTREVEGSGGLNKVLWSNGIKYNQWYFGLSLGYLFGNIRNETAILYRDQPLALDNYSRIDASYRGFLTRLGVQYELDFSDGKGMEDARDIHSLTFGLTTSFKSKFRTLSSDLVSLKGTRYGGLGDELQDELTDTLRYVEDIEGFGTLPGDFSLGAIYRKGTKWLVGANFDVYNGSKYQNDLDDHKLDNSYRLAFGAQHVPDATAFNSYFQRVMYRAGFNFGKDPRMIKGEQLNRYELNVGIGMPIVLSRQISFINFGLNYGGFSGDLPLKENYVGFNVGLTLNNNLWFLKRKFN